MTAKAISFGSGQVNEKTYKLKVSKTLKFSEIYNDEGKFVGGGIGTRPLKIENGAWVQLFEDQVFGPEDDEPRPTGRIQLHLGWTREALEEFATLLLALSRYDPPDDGYSLSFDLADQDGKPTARLVVHLPVNNIDERQPFNRLVNLFSGTVYDDGTLEDTTLPPVKGDGLQ
jgi:hypothetical protein